MNAKETAKETAFHDLTPDRVITAVEAALGVSCSNLCRPLNSYINRVFELETRDRQGLIVKFYRPGRWSVEGLQDEHDFLLELMEQEIPAVYPLRHLNGRTLGGLGKSYFAIFPKKSGRSCDEYSRQQWQDLGRLLGRVHAVGARHAPRDRVVLAPDRSTRDHIDYLLKGEFIPAELAGPFQQVAEAVLRVISPLFAGCEMIRIHGDCHFSNLVYRPEESFYIIDFDDMVTGPPVQDFWMLLPGYANESHAEIDLFLEGYETFRHFDERTLRLIEPLRAMRYIHYTAWCAHQFAEDGHSRIAPDFGSGRYWQQEIDDLADQLVRIEKLPPLTGNF